MIVLDASALIDTVGGDVPRPPQQQICGGRIARGTLRSMGTVATGGARVAELRKEQDLTQVALARRAKVSVSVTESG
ncbi:MAG: hypothetical protein ACRDRE_05530 [Pseudonocardiaceae bacterium]